MTFRTIKDQTSRHVIIIGAGDCAANRQIPALLALGIAPENIHVFATTKESGSFAETLAKKGVDLRLGYETKDAGLDYAIPELKDDVLALAQQNDAPIFITTPSFAHLGYTQAFLDAGRTVIVEKPLTCFADEIAKFQALIKSPAGQRLFCLSYYGLEKALPLTSFLNPDIPLPDGLLEAKDVRGLRLSKTELKTLYQRFVGSAAENPVREIKILLLEGGERSNATDFRGWTVDPRFGGNLIETCIHPTLLALVAHALKPDELVQLNVHRGLFEGYPVGTPATYVELAGTLHEGTKHPTKVSLLFGKHINKENTYRGGAIAYENGTRLDFDFDCKELLITNQGRQVASVKIAEALSKNYMAQMVQALAFSHNGGWQGERGDFASEQLEALVQLTKLARTREKTPAITYGSDPGMQRALLDGINSAPQHESPRNDKVMGPATPGPRQSFLGTMRSQVFTP